MQESDLRKLILEHTKASSKYTSLLKFVLGEFQNDVDKNKSTVEQIIRRTINSNNECLSIRYDEKIEAENEFLKTLLPNYMSVEELRSVVATLGLDKTGASVGKAIKYLKTNGMSFLPEDVKKAVTE